jgi:hypothetical protein
MCGIAGIIYGNGNGSRDIGRDMTLMLQSMKHRGPDSTGYALFGPTSPRFVMRYTLADANDPRDFEFNDRIARNRFLVEQRLRKHGAEVHDVEEETDYAFRVTFSYDGDLKGLTDLVEDVPGAEVLSLGHSLEIIKDLGDAETVALSTTSTASRAPTRSVTSAWRPSPTSTYRAPIPTGRIRSTTLRSCTTASSRTTSSGRGASSDPDTVFNLSATPRSSPCTSRRR